MCLWGYTAPLAKGAHAFGKPLIRPVLEFFPGFKLGPGNCPVAKGVPKAFGRLREPGHVLECFFPVFQSCGPGGISSVAYSVQ